MSRQRQRCRRGAGLPESGGAPAGHVRDSRRGRAEDEARAAGALGPRPEWTVGLGAERRGLQPSPTACLPGRQVGRAPAPRRPVTRSAPPRPGAQISRDCRAAGATERSRPWRRGRPRSSTRASPRAAGGACVSGRAQASGAAPGSREKGRDPRPSARLTLPRTRGPPRDEARHEALYLGAAAPRAREPGDGRRDLDISVRRGEPRVAGGGRGQQRRGPETQGRAWAGRGWAVGAGRAVGPRRALSRQARRRPRRGALGLRRRGGAGRAREGGARDSRGLSLAWTGPLATSTRRAEPRRTPACGRRGGQTGPPNPQGRTQGSQGRTGPHAPRPSPKRYRHSSLRHTFMTTPQNYQNTS